jgi:hypothetical protein
VLSLKVGSREDEGGGTTEREGRQLWLM